MTVHAVESVPAVIVPAWSFELAESVPPDGVQDTVGVAPVLEAVMPPYWSIEKSMGLLVVVASTANIGPVVEAVCTFSIFVPKPSFMVNAEADVDANVINAAPDGVVRPKADLPASMSSDSPEPEFFASMTVPVSLVFDRLKTDNAVVWAKLFPSKTESAFGTPELSTSN